MSPSQTDPTNKTYIPRYLFQGSFPRAKRTVDPFFNNLQHREKMSVNAFLDRRVTGLFPKQTLFDRDYLLLSFLFRGIRNKK